VATIVNINAAKSNLSMLVKRAAAGGQILITNRGTPIAMLSRVPSCHKKIPWDIFKGKIQMTDDFDAPLEELRKFV
jgi:antitoxin (DNA-binding transcriptional repressor) of toxin-antitoxin stability system